LTKNSWSVYGLIVFGILLADQLSKYLVMTRLTLGTAIDVIPHFFRIISVRNTGIVFGLFSHNSAQSHQSVFIVFTLLAIGAIVFYSYRKIRSGSPDFYPLALILGGATGNLADRFIHGKVVDFLDFYIRSYHWPAFNIADSGIVVGVSLLLLFQWYEEKKQNRASYDH
jgi:signal peptidase II